MILIFLFMIYRFMLIANNAPDLFGALLVVGVIGHIAIQVILNIAVEDQHHPQHGNHAAVYQLRGTSVLFTYDGDGDRPKRINQIRLENKRILCTAGPIGHMLKVEMRCCLRRQKEVPVVHNPCFRARPPVGRDIHTRFKNAVLPMMAAALLHKGNYSAHQCAHDTGCGLHGEHSELHRMPLQAKGAYGEIDASPDSQREDSGLLCPADALLYHRLGALLGRTGEGTAVTRAAA